MLISGLKGLKPLFIYTCQLFLSQRDEIFILRVPGFFIENPISSEDVLNITDGVLKSLEVLKKMKTQPCLHCSPF